MKCANCGGDLRYDPASFGLVCDYCGYTRQLHQPEEEMVVEELDFESAVREAKTDWGISRKLITCKQCGAVGLYDSDQISCVCPYCGSREVLTEEVNQNGIAPNGIIPFSITKEEAIAKFYKWNKWAIWAPEDFRTGKVLGNLTGVYIPYWTYDVDTLTTYSGKFGYTHTDKDGTTTIWKKRKGVVDLFINDYVVCGSRRFYNDKLLNSVISFGPKDLVPYTPDALLGFAAEKFTIGIDEAWGMAKDGMKKRLENAACRNERADTYGKLQLSTEYSNITFKHILVPVWLSSCKYNGKIYNVAISGHNGKGNCKRPVSVVKIVLFIIILIMTPCMFFFFLGVLSLIFG